MIEGDHDTRIANTKRLMAADGEVFAEKAEVDNKKRRFMNTIRPPYYWNFFEDGPMPDRVDHVLRYNAKPQDCYSDGRVEKILTNIEEIGMNLQRYEEQKWNLLKKYTLDIFVQEEKQYRKELEAA